MITIKLPDKLPEDVCIEIAKRACYCDDAISNCKYVSSSHQLAIESEEKQKSEQIIDKVQLLIDKMKTERLVLKPQIVRERKRKNDTYDGGVFKKLVSEKSISTEGVGVIARSGKFLTLLNTFDEFFERLGVKYFQSEVRNYNSLIPADWLRRANYFSSFPHSVTFTTHLKEDYHIIENFAARHKDGEDLNFKSIDEITTPQYCLSPAVCYHCYGELQGHDFSKTNNKIISYTAMNRCFRYESKNITELDRLWEFSMREIVFIGAKDEVLTAKAESLELVWKLIEILDLTAHIETASDPFFASDFKSLRFFQLANDLKYELRTPINEKDTIASGSFNYHENFMGSSFNIKADAEDFAHTGCAAFGLERLVYSTLCQIGFDKAMDRLDKAFQTLL